jgi:uncharacterized membrane protein
MAKKRLNPRGRTWVLAIFLGFVLVAAGVIQRRVFGIAQAQTIGALEDSLQALESQRRRLESDIEEARGIAVIGPIVERKLGMRVPSESTIVSIRKTPR